MKKVIIAISFIFLGLNVKSQVMSNAIPTPPVIYQQSSADLLLTANVNQQLREKVRNFNPQNYNIFSQAGQVTIQGRAASSSEADEVLSAARLTPGVVIIVNGIVTAP